MPRKQPANAYCHCSKPCLNSGQQNEQLASNIGTPRTDFDSIGINTHQGIEIIYYFLDNIIIF